MYAPRRSWKHAIQLRKIRRAFQSWEKILVTQSWITQLNIVHLHPEEPTRSILSIPSKHEATPTNPYPEISSRNLNPITTAETCHITELRLHRLPGPRPAKSNLAISLTQYPINPPFRRQRTPFDRDSSRFAFDPVAVRKNSSPGLIASGITRQRLAAGSSVMEILRSLSARHRARTMPVQAYSCVYKRPIDRRAPNP